MSLTCSDVEDDLVKPTLRFHDLQSESNWLNNAIAGFIVEEGYGYPVESVVASTPRMQETLPAGEIDINLEGWQQNTAEWYDEEIDKKTIMNLGMIYEASSQVFVVPRWVAEEYGIRTVFDMKNHWELFTDSQDPSKGAFYNCIVGWRCADINKVKLDAYGLTEYYNVVSPASAAALDSALAEPYKAHRPVFGYYWTPTALMAVHDWYVLAEPLHSEECWNQVLRAAEDNSVATPAQACAYEMIPIDKLAHAGLRDKAPEVFAMLDKMMVGLEPLNATVAWAVQNAVEDWNLAAVHYLQNNEVRWRTWVTPDAYDKIRAALKTSR
ncbi:MAG: glycine betaine ABC transporter substrate-binding protein [SAR202 cluster bacterium]|jgi:glycine betaine/proline transport system substrate-binding protein|nr:glycine betaine ABC transporter substrate-binding protein [SAR202 cluster bacterium]MDP6715966.1 glycine betaine ABC transporter substrate-binding protein [SAR202 cluster bacterium]